MVEAAAFAALEVSQVPADVDVGVTGHCVGGFLSWGVVIPDLHPWLSFAVSGDGHRFNPTSMSRML